MHSALEPDSLTLELHKSVVEQAPDAVIYADREGAVRIWNQAAETIFGYAAAEVIGKSLELIIPERFRAAHWAGFLKAVETGSTRYGDRVLTTRSMHKDGSKLYLDLSFGLIKDRNGVVAGVVAIGRNVTALRSNPARP